MQRADTLDSQSRVPRLYPPRPARHSWITPKDIFWALYLAAAGLVSPKSMAVLMRFLGTVEPVAQLAAARIRKDALAAMSAAFGPGTASSVLEDTARRFVWNMCDRRWMTSC
jgi:hypothetical protein